MMTCPKHILVSRVSDHLSRRDISVGTDTTTGFVLPACPPHGALQGTASLGDRKDAERPSRYGSLYVSMYVSMYVCMYVGAYVCRPKEGSSDSAACRVAHTHTHVSREGGGEGEGGRGRVVLGEVAGELGAVKQSARLERLVDVLSTSYLC